MSTSALNPLFTAGTLCLKTNKIGMPKLPSFCSVCPNAPASVHLLHILLHHLLFLRCCRLSKPEELLDLFNFVITKQPLILLFWIISSRSVNATIFWINCLKILFWKRLASFKMNCPLISSNGDGSNDNNKLTTEFSWSQSSKTFNPKLNFPSLCPSLQQGWAQAVALCSIAA